MRFLLGILGFWLFFVECAIIYPNQISGGDNVVYYGTNNKISGVNNTVGGYSNMVDGNLNEVVGNENILQSSGNLVIGSGNVVTNTVSIVDTEPAFNTVQQPTTSTPVVSQQQVSDNIVSIQPPTTITITTANPILSQTTQTIQSPLSTEEKTQSIIEQPIQTSTETKQPLINVQTSIVSPEIQSITQAQIISTTISQPTIYQITSPIQLQTTNIYQQSINRGLSSNTKTQPKTVDRYKSGTQPSQAITITGTQSVLIVAPTIYQQTPSINQSLNLILTTQTNY